MSLSTSLLFLSLVNLNLAGAAQSMMDEKRKLVEYFAAQKTWSVEFDQRYWKIDIPWDLVEPIRKNLEQKLQQNLKHRGEAHITVITPPEWEHLSQNKNSTKKLSIKPQKLKGQIRWLCLGRYQDQKNPSLVTYFIVIDAPFLKNWRTSRWGLSEEKFPYYPHITIGFTERDLHLQDGAVKDARSCLPDLNN